MAEPVMREYRVGDIPGLRALWSRVFGDSEALISGFLRLLPEMGTGAVALAGDRIVGAAYVMTGLELVRPGRAEERLGYIYAVAVDESCRGLGLGRGLCLMARELARRHGAERICTLPAEGSLYAWYEDVLGLKAALRRRLDEIAAAPGPFSFREVSAGDYGAAREALLGRRDHLRPGRAALEFQELLCRDCGGGLYAFEGGLAAAYPENGRLHVKELICSGPARPVAAGALAAHLGFDSALLWSPALSGEDYIAAPPGLLPPDCVWNLSFD